MRPMNGWITHEDALLQPGVVVMMLMIMQTQDIGNDLDPLRFLSTRGVAEQERSRCPQLRFRMLGDLENSVGFIRETAPRAEAQSAFHRRACCLGPSGGDRDRAEEEGMRLER